MPEESVKLILKMIKKINKKNIPVLLMGDFNLTPETKPIKTLKRDSPMLWDQQILMKALMEHSRVLIFMKTQQEGLIIFLRKISKFLTQNIF